MDQLDGYISSDDAFLPLADNTDILAERISCGNNVSSNFRSAWVTVNSPSELLSRYLKMYITLPALSLCCFRDILQEYKPSNLPMFEYSTQDKIASPTDDLEYTDEDVASGLCIEAKKKKSQFSPSLESPFYYSGKVASYSTV